MFFERNILLLGRYGFSIYLGSRACYGFFGGGMFHYLVWVDMYTPGGSAFEFHFIAHDCQSIEFRIIVLRYQWIS